LRDSKQAPHLDHRQQWFIQALTAERDANPTKLKGIQRSRLIAEEARMTTYLCKFVTPSGRVYGVEKLVVADDAAAISKADCLLAHSIGGGYEIKDGERLVKQVSVRPLTIHAKITDR
jgi:hypothetical protein